MIVNSTSTAGGDNLQPSIEYDMHGVICRKGLYVDVLNGTPNLTIEFM